MPTGFDFGKFDEAVFGAIYKLTLTESITVTDTVVKRAGKVLSEVVTIVDTISYFIGEVIGRILGLNKDWECIIRHLENSC